MIYCHERLSDPRRSLCGEPLSDVPSVPDDQVPPNQVCHGCRDIRLLIESEAPKSEVFKREVNAAWEEAHADCLNHVHPSVKLKNWADSRAFRVVEGKERL